MEDIIRKPAFWGLDPLFHAYVKLFAGMLGGMVPGEWGNNDSVYFYSFVPGYPRPVRLVSLAGVVIFISKHQKVNANCPLFSFSTNFHFEVKKPSVR